MTAARPVVHDFSRQARPEALGRRAGDMAAPAVDPGIRIVTYEPGMEERCLGLLAAAMGESPVSPRTGPFWTWKHRQNPFGVSDGLVAMDPRTEDLVGLRVFMAWRLRTPDGRLVVAARAVDTATHPEYRRQGIFAALTGQALARLRANRVEVVFNTPNPRSLPGYLQLGWRRTPDRQLLFRILEPASFTRRLFRPRQASEGIPAWESCFEPAVPRWPEFSRRSGDQVRAVTEAWEATRRRAGYRTPRSPDYLDWRYGGHPSLSYGVVEVADTNGLAGFAILRPNRRYGGREVLLVEMALREPRLSLGLKLMKEVRRRVRADWIVAHAAPGTLERRMLRLSGYHGWPGHAIPLTVLAVCGDERDLHRGWDLSLGDLEIF